MAEKEYKDCQCANWLKRLPSGRVSQNMFPFSFCPYCGDCLEIETPNQEVKNGHVDCIMYKQCRYSGLPDCNENCRHIPPAG